MDAVTWQDVAAGQSPDLASRGKLHADVNIGKTQLSSHRLRLL
jgi:hypothetical protein